MDAITLGPLMLPLPRLAALASLLVFVILSERLVRREPAFGRWSWYGLAAIAAGGRLGHVAANAEAYAAQPWTALYLWQGGFSFVGAAAALMLLTVLYFRRRPVLLRRTLLPLALAAAPWLGYCGLQPLLRGLAPALPDLMVTQLDGAPVRLSALRGQPLVLNLWATWCAPCRREMPLLQEMAAAYPQVRFLLVNQGESPEQVSGYLRAAGLDGAQPLLDPASALADYYRAPGFPMTLIYDAEGREIGRHLGELSRAYLTKELKRLGR